MAQFSDLPSCLVIDILSRLPLTTLVTCICVCKDWIRLLRDPHLIKLQLAASPVHILNRHIGKDEQIFQIGQFMEDTTTTTGDVEVKILNLPTKVDFLTTGIYDYVCVDSCNGLLCLMDSSNRSVPLARSIRVCVCNPILGEWVSIPTPVRNYVVAGNYRLFATAMALVFSEKNNQYKLLHGFKTKEEEDDYGYEIYTLGGNTRQWRSIDETHGCRPWLSSTIREAVNTFLLHGSLHWISRSSTRQEWFICCFDVDYEKFRKRISLPPLPSFLEDKLSSNSLGAINDCLCLFVFYGYDDDDEEDHTDEVEIWVMKEYGVEKSWGKVLTIPVRLSLPYLLFSQNEDEILMYDDTEGLVSYNLKRNTRKYWQGGCREKSCYFYFRVEYKPSFISLQDVAKGEEVILSRTMQIIQ